MHVNAMSASRKDSHPLPRAMHSGEVSPTADGRLDGGLIEWRSLPEPCPEEPDLDWFHWRRWSLQRDKAATEGAEKRLAAVPANHHGGDAPDLDVLREPSAPVQDGASRVAPALDPLVSDAIGGSVDRVRDLPSEERPSPRISPTFVPNRYGPVPHPPRVINGFARISRGVALPQEFSEVR